MSDIELQLLQQKCNEVEDLIVGGRASDRFRLRAELQALRNTLQLMRIKKAVDERSGTMRRSEHHYAASCEKS